MTRMNMFYFTLDANHIVSMDYGGYLQLSTWWDITLSGYEFEGLSV